MFNLSSRSAKKLAGPSYVILNILRCCNIIALLTVVVGSWIMLVRTVQTSEFFFFDATSHFITSTIGMFLIGSEIGVFGTYFAANWPLLAESSSFVFLGLTMIVLGFNVLANLNKPATSQDNLGLPLWRVVIAGGILTPILGVFNVIVSFVFRNRAAGISARQVRSQGASSLPPLTQNTIFPKSGGSFSTTSSPRDKTVLPSYHVTTAPDNRRSKFGFRFPIKTMEISKPIPTDPDQFKDWESRSSPIVPEIQRPPTAQHPAYSPSRYTASRYSDASAVTRF